MDIKPVKVAYNLEILNHKMMAKVKHLDDGRQISFYYDDKLVSEKKLPAGDLLSDDDCISEIVLEYSENNTGLFADIFRNHSDKVSLVSKLIEVIIEIYGLQIDVRVGIEKEKYIVKLSANDGNDTFVGTFKALNFSEVLEKTRIFTSTLEGVSTALADNINEISSDKVEERIKWK